MHQIELRGLPVSHPAAALATYGLYAAVPESMIHFERGQGSYFPVLHSEFASIDALATHLADTSTWGGLNLPPSKSIADLDHTDYFLADFKKLSVKDEHIAVGIGTDMKLIMAKQKTATKRTPKKLKRFEVSVGKSPFNLLTRTDAFYDKVTKLVSMIGDPQTIKSVLSRFPWKNRPGANFGFFWDAVGKEVFRNRTMKKKSGESPILTVPIICALVIASWRMLPCFVQGKTVVTPGWHQDDKTGWLFTYPVFTRPHTQQEAVSWLHNSSLSDFARNRLCWTKLGIPAAYQIKIHPGENGGGNISEASSL